MKFLIYKIRLFFATKKTQKLQKKIDKATELLVIKRPKLRDAILAESKLITDYHGTYNEISNI